MRGMGITELLELTKFALGVWSEQKHRLEHLFRTIYPHSMKKSVRSSAAQNHRIIMGVWLQKEEVCHYHSFHTWCMLQD